MLLNISSVLVLSFVLPDLNSFFYFFAIRRRTITWRCPAPQINTRHSGNSSCTCNAGGDEATVESKPRIRACGHGDSTTGPAYINTGFWFYTYWDVMFDLDAGVVGFRPAQ